MRGIVGLSAVVFFLAGCGGASGSTREVATTPTGVKIFESKCRDSALDCGLVAQKQCYERGFEALSGESHPGGAIADLVPGPFTWFSMQFRCGGSSEMPTFVSGAPEPSVAGALLGGVAAGANAFAEPRNEAALRECRNGRDCDRGEVCVTRDRFDSVGFCGYPHR